ncbi:Nramp family divalent metal transporter [Alteromonas pelagimontana]|uniref:Nramp family divalent metal transporter n=1 Tax=Alteromonas pelagimontana TaxID=1858656 RepID=A0A6M4MC58_9ALTE|nr:Nramp family divalent metal transporter [Alteromonas pelagimontana]QJR80125.1 Nramp family divalent metal transporter [Alteromonas pelagimontana]
MAKDKSGYIIAAAFIGPGTVTTASLAGANFGFHLVWALLFSIVATMVLQDMAARLGVATGKGLASNLRDMATAPWLQKLFTLLIIAAIGIGNAAYESGNLTGAAIGLNAFADLGTGTWALLLGVLAVMLMWTGRYRLIETVLVVLVFIMALVFVLTLIFTKPDWQAMFLQLLSPQLDVDTITMVLALIGTTIVPYNLFLHASLVAKNYQGAEKAAAIRASRRQSAIAIGVGGLITLVIVATAMMAFFHQAATMDVTNMGNQLSPVLGEWAQWLFAMGLFAAGLTSAITAPLAAAFAVCGALNLKEDLTSWPFRAIWLAIIITGVAIAAAGFKPLAAIVFAQAANGVLLPVIAVFLLIVMNKNKQLGAFRNGTTSNLLGLLVVTVVVCLGLYKLGSLSI